MTFLIFLYVFSLPIGLLLVAWHVKNINEERRLRALRVTHGYIPYDLYSNSPILMASVPRIEPSRAPDVTAYVRLVPHPTDYRKFIRVVEGVSEDPFEVTKPSTHGPLHGND